MRDKRIVPASASRKWRLRGASCRIATLVACIIVLAALVDVRGAQASAGARTGSSPPSGAATATSGALANGHYLYVFPDGNMYVYAMDRGFALVDHETLPTASGVRGVAADPRRHVLYLSFGSDGGPGGQLLKYDLATRRVVWTRSYMHGVDSFALTPDGTTIYMPGGEVTDNGKWYEVRASDGRETGRVIDTGAGTGDNGPHDSIVSLDGRYVYLGDRNFHATSARGDNLYQYDRTTHHLKAIGPFRGGIRPFTVNRAHTLAYTALTGFLGFQVGDLDPHSRTYGRVVATVGITRPADAFCPNSGASTPSHGISLSPDESELYVLDFPCNAVHVFDVRGAHARAPEQVADIPVTPFTAQETPCGYDCLGDGWLLHSLDGSYVLVGDSGDIISTATRSRVATLDALHNTREFIEIDWSGGVPVATSTRVGMGRAASARPSPPQRPPRRHRRFRRARRRL